MNGRIRSTSAGRRAGTSSPYSRADRPIAARPQGETRHVVVDTDCGIDDALALLYLAGRRPECELAAVTTVHGNAPVGAVVANVGHVLGLAARPEWPADVPVAVGAAGPLDGAPVRAASGTHGSDGLGDLVAVKTPPRTVVDLSAAEYLAALARERPGHYDLLTLGPLTNVALALELEPSLLTLFRSVMVMGGLTGVLEPGDTNVRRDPVAAGRVLHAPRNRLVSVGVDVTATVVVDEDGVRRLRASGTPRAEFAAALVERYAERQQQVRGRRVAPVHDALAAALLLRPDWIIARRTGPATVVTDVDRAAFLADLLDGLAMDFG
ncbi:nucleoside hydrolase [Jiangella aurantiaca]|uniref:nucleoside hydrolase n=1 Tax=Jiangella aurantiaca TaxID=2530373 RepID=UPI0013A5D948|nr:nucleoside hydrolase [Jiangella aurantiaca]